MGRFKVLLEIFSDITNNNSHHFIKGLDSAWNPLKNNVKSEP